MDAGPVENESPKRERPLQWVVDDPKPEGWESRYTIFGVPLDELNVDELRACLFIMGSYYEKLIARLLGEPLNIPAFSKKIANPG